MAVWDTKKISKPQRLYWALYDPFSSSTASFSSLNRQDILMEFNSSVFSNNNGIDCSSFKGTIRSGFVERSLTHSPSDPLTTSSHLPSSISPNPTKLFNPTLFPHSDISSYINHEEVQLPDVNYTRISTTSPPPG